MSRRATAGSTLLDDFDDVVALYRSELSKPARLPDSSLEPVRVGPTWEIDGKRWRLPKHSIGWDVLGWSGCVYQHSLGEPWRYTLEQARFLLWWYGVDEAGRFLFRDGVLQRLKGWGKDPLGACIAGNELLGPARVIDWDKGQPVSGDVETAWVQTAAVSLEQTKNTMRLFPALWQPQAKAAFGLQVGKELVHARQDTRLLQAVTSSPATLEGARATFVLLNETHLWDSSNNGHDMADVIERNATKSPDGAARTLRITNAYEPGQDSVGERDRDAFEEAEAGTMAFTGLLYDSLEAPPEAPLRIKRRDGESDDEYRERVLKELPEVVTEVVKAIRGDSVWLTPSRIVESILDSRNPESRSRRFWYNQIWAAEDSWVTRQEWDALESLDRPGHGAIITLGFDGSMTDDWSALIGCDVERDQVFVVDIWDPAKHGGEAPRTDIDAAVRSAFNAWDVVGFYSDLHPWESYVDAWADDLAEDRRGPRRGGLCVKATSRHPIAWDMRGRQRESTVAAERFRAAIVDKVLSHDGSKVLAQHVYNARRRPNQYGVTFGKEHRESSKKVDALAAAVLARLARLDYLSLPANRRRRPVGATKASFL